MATRSPTPFHSFWGAYPTVSLPTSAEVEVGDTAYNSTLGSLVVCTAVGPVVWSPVGGSVSAPIQVEVDFGTLPSWGAEFAIIDPSVSPTSVVTVTESGATATGRVGNDQAWDQLSLAALAGTGIFIVTAIPYPGPVVGKRKILYQVF